MSEQEQNDTELVYILELEYSGAKAGFYGPFTHDVACQWIRLVLGSLAGGPVHFQKGTTKIAKWPLTDAKLAIFAQARGASDKG